MSDDKKLKDLLSTAMLAGTLTLGAQIADLTPDSWKAHAMSKKSEKKAEKTTEMKCAPGKCGGDMKKAAKAGEKSCGANSCGVKKKAKKKMTTKKGNEKGCGENGCA
ncbi:hypothetical protein N9B72_01245 [Bacteriovoracaceae bacterium]|nr:hypothetical protein [Bacteriovoracaceae bacterium]